MNYSQRLSFAEVKFYPVSDQPFGLRPLKYLKESNNATGKLWVHGPDIGYCSTYDTLVRSTTTTHVPPRTSTDFNSVSLK